MKKYKMVECHECCKRIFPIKQQTRSKKHYCGKCNLLANYAPAKLVRLLPVMLALIVLTAACDQTTCDQTTDVNGVEITLDGDFDGDAQRFPYPDYIFAMQVSYGESTWDFDTDDIKSMSKEELRDFVTCATFLATVRADDEVGEVICDKLLPSRFKEPNNVKKTQDSQ